MVWVTEVGRGGRALSGLVPLTTGYYSESPVGSPDCMTFWPAGERT